MKLHPVSKSTQIKYIGYSRENSELEIVFVSGGHYRYKGVPPEVYVAFARSKSLGQFFHANIRGRYDFLRLNPPLGEKTWAKQKERQQQSKR
jgi:hypothetical protein